VEWAREKRGVKVKVKVKREKDRVMEMVEEV
jgi:hypothetical protein